MDWLGQLQVLGEVAVAMFLGGAIGIEREAADKPAGFRTNMLVAGAAALLIGLGEVILVHFTPQAEDGFINSDPFRLVGAVITGISFLGAGTIFRRDRTEQVEGLTTAASILFSGAIGVCVALHQFVLAVGLVVLTLAVLRGLKMIDWGPKVKKGEELS